MNGEALLGKVRSSPAVERNGRVSRFEYGRPSARIGARYTRGYIFAFGSGAQNGSQFSYFHAALLAACILHKSRASHSLKQRHRRSFACPCRPKHVSCGPRYMEQETDSSLNYERARSGVFVPELLKST